MPEKMPMCLRLTVLVWVTLLSLPSQLLPPPASMRCTWTSAHNNNGSSLLTTATLPPQWQQSLVCHRVAGLSGEAAEEADAAAAAATAGGGYPYYVWRTCLLYVCDTIRPWHIPMLGAVQLVMVHLPSLFHGGGGGGARYIERARCVLLLERIVYLPALQTCVFMLLWILTGADPCVFWTLAAHGALQYAWDIHSLVRSLPGATRDAWWLRVNLVLFAGLEMPLLAYFSGGLLQRAENHPLRAPLSAADVVALAAIAHLEGWIVAELCSDAFGAAEVNKED